MGARHRGAHHASGPRVRFLYQAGAAHRRRVSALSIRGRHAAGALPFPHRRNPRIPDGQHRAQRDWPCVSRDRSVPPLRLFIFPGFCFPVTGLHLRVPGRILAGSVEGRCSELHGILHRHIFRDGSLHHARADPLLRPARLGCRRRGAADFADRLVACALDAARLPGPRLSLFRFLPLGRVSGIRHERRFRHPHHSSGIHREKPCSGQPWWAAP